MYSYVTLLSSADYLPGVLVLNESLHRAKSKHKLTVLISNDFQKAAGETVATLKSLAIDVENYGESFVLTNEVLANISTDRWKRTFGKLKVFGFDKFEKVVFLDADMLVVRNIDHLFNEKNLTFSNGIDTLKGYENWRLPNTGLMILVPEAGLDELIFKQCAEVQKVKPDFSDQDLIQSYFLTYFEQGDSWMIPAIYNCYASLMEMIIRQLGYNFNVENPDERTIAVVHYTSKVKPWMIGRRSYLWLLARKVLRGKFNEVKALMLYQDILKKCRSKTISQEKVF